MNIQFMTQTIPEGTDSVEPTSNADVTQHVPRKLPEWVIGLALFGVAFLVYKKGGK